MPDIEHLFTPSIGLDAVEAVSAGKGLPRSWHKGSQARKAKSCI